ncbi:MAG: tetratricopeptide repeat protein [Bacteroidota bacterium]
MKNIAYILVLLLISARENLLADPLQDFYAGNQAYQSEQYEEAISAYERVLIAGEESAELYFNLGNAYYRTSQLAPAILNYERALELSPDNEDIITNLRLANLRVVDNLEPKPEFLVQKMWKDWVASNHSGGWGIWAVILLWAALAAGAAFLLGASGVVKRVGFFAGIGLTVVSLLFLTVGLEKRGQETNSKQGIIFTQNAYVKASPDQTAQDLLILHEGVKVRILRTTGSWTEIKISDANVGEIAGWLNQQAIQEI